jgi:hypothetical protein
MTPAYEGLRIPATGDAFYDADPYRARGKGRRENRGDNGDDKGGRTHAALSLSLIGPGKEGRAPDC